MASRISSLEDEVRRLKNRTTTTLQKGQFAELTVLDDVTGNEGEMRIDPLTNQPIWYVNGAWRKIATPTGAGTFRGSELRLSADWTMPGNGFMAVKTDVIRYDTDGFAGSVVAPEGFTYYQWKIPVGMAGVYLVTANCMTTNTAIKPRIELFESTGTDLSIGYAITTIQTSTDSDISGAWVAWFADNDNPFIAISGNTSVVVKADTFNLKAHFNLTLLGATYDPGGLTNP